MLYLSYQHFNNHMRKSFNEWLSSTVEKIIDPSTNQIVLSFKEKDETTGFINQFVEFNKHLKFIKSMRVETVPKDVLEIKVTNNDLIFICTLFALAQFQGSYATVPKVLKQLTTEVWKIRGESKELVTFFHYVKSIVFFHEFYASGFPIELLLTRERSKKVEPKPSIHLETKKGDKIAPSDGLMNEQRLLVIQLSRDLVNKDKFITVLGKWKSKQFYFAAHKFFANNVKKAFMRTFKMGIAEETANAKLKIISFSLEVEAGIKTKDIIGQLVLAEAIKRYDHIEEGLLPSYTGHNIRLSEWKEINGVYRRLGGHQMVSELPPVLSKVNRIY